MAHAPPSYEAAAYRQLWIIVAPYVHSYDLYRACLVCRQWHQLFAPFLWGDPARKFGFDDDNIYCMLLFFDESIKALYLLLCLPVFSIFQFLRLMEYIVLLDIPIWRYEGVMSVHI